jgi:signal transduction histidine kinase
MKKLLYLYLIFSAFLFAGVEIQNFEINLQDFEVGYYVDKSKKLTFEEIQKRNFIAEGNKKSFSNHSTHLWIKIEINNKNSKKQKLFLHHTNAYRLSYIKFYEMQEDKLIKSFEMNLSKRDESKYMYGTDAIYKFSIPANETKIIYIQATSFIYQYCNIMLFDERHSAQHLASQNLPIIIILGILIGLMFYHFILYLITSFKDYLYYSLYLFFNILWGSYEYGVMGKYFGWYGEDFFIFDLMIIFTVISLSFFIKNIIQTSKFYPTENKLINFIIISFTLNFTYIFIDIYNTLYFFVITMTIMGGIYIGIIISLYRKKDKYVLYILFAQIWFMFFGLISLAFYEGVIEYNFFTRYSFILGIVLDTFAFSYLLSHRIRLVQEENKKNIHKTKRLQALSELLENISHQWRQPLTRINSSVMNIVVEMKKNRISNKNIDNKLDDIENLSVYLSQTIDDFKSLYRKDREVSQFNLNNAVNDSILLIEEEYKIQVTVDISKDIYLNNYLNELKQVLQVILNNAKDALLEQQTLNPNILFFAEKKEKQIILKISNNGGEIEKTIIDKIFNAHFTTKKQGEGIGLFMSQKIVTELMNASLTCHNITGGTCFEIKFNIKQ